MNTSFDFSFQSNSNYHTHHRDSYSVKPLLRNYQLLGDSLFVRFADQILHQPNRIIRGARTIGHCVSGQRIDQLRRRIKHNMYPLSSKVMVLIGTNDVLCGGDHKTMIKHFYKLFKLLKKTVDKVLILTLPPIPKLSVTYYHWTIIRQYNLFLKSLHDGSSVVVVDICPIFTKFQEALQYKIPPFKFKNKKPTEKRKIENESSPESMSESPRKYKKLSSCGKDSLEFDHKWASTPNTKRESDVKSSEISPEIKKLDYGWLKSSRFARKSVETDVSSHKNSSETNKDLNIQKEESRKSLNSFIKATTSVSPEKKTPTKKEPTSRIFLKSIQDIIKNKGKKSSQLDDSKSSEIFSEEESGGRNICATNRWIVEADEDSMDDLVYQSQEEVEYDYSEVKNDVNHNINSEFLKYIESTNESKNVGSEEKRRRRESTESESSSSSDSDCQTPKRQMFPYIDSNFLNFFKSSEKNSRRESGGSIFEFDSSLDNGRRQSFTSSELDQHNKSWNRRSSYVPPPTPPPMPSFLIHESWNRNKSFSIDEEIKNMHGFSSTDKLIMKYSNDICRLDYYELFYSFGKKRMDMIHLNYRGLDRIRRYLIDNEYLCEDNSNGSFHI